MFSARSIWSFIATTTATQCSAALPTIPTTNTPMKKGERPIERDAPRIEWTRTSLITPTRTAPTASSTTDLRTDQTPPSG